MNIERNAQFGGGKEIEIGDNSGIGINCKIPNNIYIGDNVMMGPDTIIIGENHKFRDIDRPIIEQGYEERKRVYIDDDVWIGTRSIILPGIRIGRGVVIGAGSVVTKDVNDYDIIAGNPARIIRNRKIDRLKNGKRN